MDIQKHSSHKYMSLLFGLGLIGLLTLTYLLYSPGISGIFLFDDTPNLSLLGSYPHLSFWDNFWIFLLEGFSGPTGRPISLASFYLNDTHWPSEPVGFIHTNILIHLLNGILVFWLIHKLSAYIKWPQEQQAIFTLGVTAFWLLHPIHITSVLYVIQRMTELSATFVLTGLLFFIYGREKLERSKLSGFLVLFFGVGISLVLSILSKENGILLVAYILVIEFFFLQPLKHEPPKNFYTWLIPAVILPFIVILIYLGSRIDSDSFYNRDFTLAERLLTEPRVLFDYLRIIILPNMGELTLYHDDYIISKNLFTTWTTLPAIIGLIMFAGLAIYLRKRVPLIAFGIAWFFAGHLIESTVLPLELYFEHRNYLPLLGVCIPIGFYAIHFYKKLKVVIVAITLSLLLLNSFMLYQNTKQWGKPLELFASWYQNHPDSGRTQQQYRFSLNQKGLNPDHFLTNNQSDQKNISPMLKASIALADLTTKCELGEATEEDVKQTLNIMNGNIIHNSAAASLTSLVNSWFNAKCSKVTLDQFENFLLTLASREEAQNVPVFAHEVHYALSRIYVSKRNLDKTISYLETSYKNYPTLNGLILRAFYLSSAGIYEKALEVLKDTSELEKDFRSKLALKIRMKEINRLKNIIEQKTMK